MASEGTGQVQNALEPACPAEWLPRAEGASQVTAGRARAGLGFADPMVYPPLSSPAVGTHGRGEAREPLLLPGGPRLGLRVPGRST